MLGFVASTTHRGINKTEFLSWRRKIIKYLSLSISCVCLRTLHAQIHWILTMTIGRCYCNHYFPMSPREVVNSPASLSLPTFFIFLFQFFCYFLAAHVLANVKYCVWFFSFTNFLLSCPTFSPMYTNDQSRQMGIPTLTWHLNWTMRYILNSLGYI